MGDLVYDERFDAASFAGISNGAAIASYLQLVMQSSLFRHALLMGDGQFGVEREVVHKEGIESVPVVPWDHLSKAQRADAAELSGRLHGGLTESLAEDINAFVFDVFGLSDVSREAVRDTLLTAPPTADAKRNALRPVTSKEKEAFARVCEASMQSVLSASGLTATVRFRGDLDFGVWRIIQVDRFLGRPPPLATLNAKTFLEAADDAAASLVVVRKDAVTTLIGMLDRYRYWTRTRARVLAATLLSEPHDNA
jgi:hypothetical protein